MNGRKLSKRKKAKKGDKISTVMAKVRCFNCGAEGPHFVPPSWGDEGFYVCADLDPQYGL